MKLLNFSIAFLLCVAGCAGIEQGTGQVLGNANSVIRTESPKIWMPKEHQDTEGTPEEEEEKKKQ